MSSTLPPLPGYRVKHERVAVAGVADLVIRSLLDRQQFFDPHGDAERSGISSAAWPLFGLLWPSGAQLAALVAARPVRGGERILEVGCGLALASLVGHRCGADMTASDCHPLAGDFLRENLRLNALQPMKYHHGPWSSRESPAQGYDLVIGSDLLYDRDASTELPGYIARHADAGAEVWIVDPDRGNRPAFNRAMRTHGFSVHQERLDSVATGDALAYKGRLLVYRRAGALTPA